LKQRNEGTGAAIPSFITLDLIQTLFVKVCLNALNIRPQNPFSVYYSGLIRQGQAGRTTKNQVLDKIVEVHKIDLRSGDEYFRQRCGTDATALFSLMSYINHTCRNNAQAQSYNFQTNTIDVVALQNLSAGMEIMISYVDPKLKRSRRQVLLENSFCFLCDCDLCEKESESNNVCGMKC